ncbi:TIM23 complex component [Vanrija albida]|uniref:Presequence translocated-associated motor subunit PAM17 n=1 Tax=Vanrija albida TaxID=181172 RepID=A0ABR3QCU2_9TREE
MSTASLRNTAIPALGRVQVRTASPALARFASSDAATSSTGESSTHTGKLPMSWSEYLAMRKRRKQWSTLTTIPTTAAGLFAGAAYFATAQPEFGGLDPFFIAGAGTCSSMALGYLVGPSIGNGIFSVTHPKLARGNPPPLDIMDREFYHRIKSKRADPSRQSVNNPAPDFYGEKIVSLATYRRWLKDQEAYRRKAAHGVDGEEP